MRKKQRLITLQQIEDWVIYHCPLQPTQQIVAQLFKLKASDYPFTVTLGLDGFDVNFQTSDATPWKAYRALAEMIYDNPTARTVLTREYYRS